MQDSSRRISAHACTERAVFTLVLHLVQASDQDCNGKRCNGRLQSAGLRPLAAPAARGIPSLSVSRGEAGPPGRAGCCCRGTSRAGRAACLPPDRPRSRQGAAAPGTCRGTLKIRKLTAGIGSEQARREATSLRHGASIVRETRQCCWCLEPMPFERFLEIWRLAWDTAIGSESPVYSVLSLLLWVQLHFVSITFWTCLFRGGGPVTEQERKSTFSFRVGHTVPETRRCKSL